MRFRVALIALLVVAFLLAYQVSTAAPLAGLAIFLGSTLAVLFVIARRAGRGAHVNNRGITLMGEGRLVEAIAAFEEASRLMGLSPLPAFNVGFAKLWLWRLEEARVALERGTTSLRGKPLRVIGAPALLLIAALQNERARAVVLEKELATLKLERSAVVAIARAVFLAREKRWKEVLETLSLERTRPLGGPARAVSDALRAWAMVELGGTCPPIDAVGVFGETGPIAVRQSWPEFADFIERVTARA